MNRSRNEARKCPDPENRDNFLLTIGAEQTIFLARQLILSIDRMSHETGKARQSRQLHRPAAR